MVLAAEPVARGYCRNNTQHLAHRRLAVLVKLDNVIESRVSQLMVFRLMLMLSEPVGGTGQSRLHLARNIELPQLNLYGS